MEICLIDLFLIAFGLISIMNVIKDFKNKIFIFSAPIFLAIISVWNLIDSLISIKSFIETVQDIYILSVFLPLAFLLFSVVLFILSMPLYKAAEENQRLDKTIGLSKNVPAIEALPLLNTALENGTITQEQYQTKRAEIFSKL